MPLTIPNLDDRKYQDLLNEALARIRVHNPEWTNFNKSDPGVTILEILAFLTENLLYRTNQIPERNRRKFLSLLGLPLQPATSAQGLVTFSNERGPLRTVTLNNNLEVRAGQVPFRTEQGLDVLPIEAAVFYKRLLPDARQQPLKDYYKQLYASYAEASATVPGDSDFTLYETVPLSPRGVEEVDLSTTVDNSLWVALLVRASDKPYPEAIKQAQEELAGKTLSLGLVPAQSKAEYRLNPGGQANPAGRQLLQYQIPKLGKDGLLPTNRVPTYLALPASSEQDVLTEPGMVQITLPPNKDEIGLWTDIKPLESGVGEFPPALDDTNLNDRVITWLRLSPPAARAQIPGSGGASASAALQARFLWAGINTVFASQRVNVTNELLPVGTGQPDQVMVLSRTPVIPGSVKLTVEWNGQSKVWEEIDDLMAAGSEVAVPDLRLPPGATLKSDTFTKPEVFALNAESGELTFGDGTRGARPPFGAIMRANYAYGMGLSGNVNAGSINSSPTLPAGFKVNNPIRTWGGSEAETVSEGEKQITRYLQHRDRLVNLEDFVTITRRTPGVDIGRVEAIPAFSPELPQNEPGDVPGAVTVMVIPKYDPVQPASPLPDQLFLDTVAAYLNPRRLVTTEIFLRGPDYKPIWVSIGLDVMAGASVAQVREDVKQALVQFLSPLPPPGSDWGSDPEMLLTVSQYGDKQRGWPLRKPVVALELLAVASRVKNVLLVNKVLLAEDTKDPSDQVSIRGLELPRLAGISVTVGEALTLAQLRGQATSVVKPKTAVVPVPVIPEECR